VYWVSFVVFCWFFFFSFLNCGMIIVSSCMMMFVVMYGMMLSAKMDSCSRVLLLNMLIRLSKELFLVVVMYLWIVG